MMVRTIPETQSILLKIARERWREGRTSHVIEHEVVLCEDGTTAMVYFYFGLPGDDAVMARRRGDRSAGLACPGQLTKKIKDLFDRQGSVSISYLSRESLLGTCWYESSDGCGVVSNEQVLAARHLRICRNSRLVLCSKSALCGSGAYLRITSRRLRITSRRPPIRATSRRLRITSRRPPIRATSRRLRIRRLRITRLRITSRRPPIRATSRRLVKSNSHHILKNGLCEQARSSVSREPTAGPPHVADRADRPTDGQNHGPGPAHSALAAGRVSARARNPAARCRARRRRRA
jgi:hypothetical protein